MIDDNKKNFKKMLKQGGIYLALGIVVLAAGVAGFSSSGNIVPGKTEEATKDKYEYITLPEITTNKSEEYTGMKINIEEFTTAEYTEPSTAAVFDSDSEKIDTADEEEEIYFSAPLKNATGKLYSTGVPVFSKTLGDYRTHNGVDFNGVKGESVKTVAEGTVISVEANAVWGNTVKIDHGNGIESTVSGLGDEALISTGAKVYSDTIIGVVGSVPVEGEDDSHIHLEMRVNGELVDPLEILGLAENDE